MHSERRKAFSKIFIAIYILFSALLAYLLFFNSGIEIRDEFNPFTGDKEIIVANTTDRVINNVQVKYVSGGTVHDLNGFARLDPKQKKRLPAETMGQGKVNVVVQAPFHIAVEKTVDLDPKAGRPLRIDVPQTAKIGESFEFSVQICNYSEDPVPVGVQEIHEPLVFFSPNRENAFTLQSQECQKLSYSLEPGKGGETTIYFNVNFANSNEQFQKTVSVG